MSKFSVIVMDCPWSFSDKLKMSETKRGAVSNYNTLSINDLKSLKIKELADENGCVLAMWVPSSLIRQGLELMEEYGFTCKQTYIWVKTKKNPLEKITKNINKLFRNDKNLKIKETLKEVIDCFSMHDILSFFMGRLFRSTHEIALIGTNNNKIYKKLQNKSQRSVCFSENIKHSAKPEDLQNSFDIMFSDTRKIEVFARRSRENWICIGNEAPDTFGEDIRVSINRLINEKNPSA